MVLLLLVYQIVVVMNTSIDNNFEVIVIGGSYAGLSAGLALGRSLRKTLILDSETPCNRSTPHSHNFLTRDGEVPAEIIRIAKLELHNYKTVNVRNELAIDAVKMEDGFEITTKNGVYQAKRIILATGVKDIMPAINGFAACWGKSVIHCPYCHGYEVKELKTGVLMSGEPAIEHAIFISHWAGSGNVILFTNGNSEYTVEQVRLLKEHGIVLVEKKITRLAHTNGYLNEVCFSDGSKEELTVLYAHCAYEQQTNLPKLLGCTIGDDGLIVVDELQHTSVTGVFACGDAAGKFRTVANAVAKGGFTGMILNKEMIVEDVKRNNYE